MFSAHLSLCEMVLCVSVVWTRVDLCPDGDLLEEGMVTHCSILAWRIPMGQRCLAGYSPWGHKELDTTERLTRKWFCILIVVVVIRVCTWIITHIHHTNVNFLVLILYDYLQCNHWERLGDWV